MKGNLGAQKHYFPSPTLYRPQCKVLCWLLKLSTVSAAALGSRNKKSYLMPLISFPLWYCMWFYLRVTVCSRQTTSLNATVMKQWKRSVNCDHPLKEMPSFSSQKWYLPETSDKLLPLVLAAAMYQTVPTFLFGTLWFASSAGYQNNFFLKRKKKAPTGVALF